MSSLYQSKGLLLSNYEIQLDCLTISSTKNPPQKRMTIFKNNEMMILEVKKTRLTYFNVLNIFLSIVYFQSLFFHIEASNTNNFLPFSMMDKIHAFCILPS